MIKTLYYHQMSLYFIKLLNTSIPFRSDKNYRTDRNRDRVLRGGVIFKNADNVVGVTSAAFIWLIASIGVLIGIGYIITSITLTMGLLILMLSLQKLENKINKK